jgi:hypothetical protein
MGRTQKVIRLMPEVPQDLRLAYPEGKTLEDGRVMLSTTDGWVLFLPADGGQAVQQQLRDLRIQPGDRVLIRESITHGPTGKTVSWEVYRAQVALGQQRDGSFVVPNQPGGAATISQVAAPVSDRDNGHSTRKPPESPYEHSGTAAGLRERANMLVDVYAACLAYAKRYPDVSAEDVRAFVLAVFASPV